MPVCLSVSVSRLLLSSSSHCVVSTSEKRGTKKEKKKSLPLQSQNLSRPLPIIVSSTVPSTPLVCPHAWLLPPLGLWSSSHHTSQIILTWLLPAGC